MNQLSGVRNFLFIVVSFFSTATWAATEFWVNNLALTKTAYKQGETVALYTRIRPTSNAGTYLVETRVINPLGGVRVASKSYSLPTASSTALPVYNFVIPTAAPLGTYSYSIRVLSADGKISYTTLGQVSLKFTVSAGTTATPPPTTTFSWVKGFNVTGPTSSARPAMNVPFTEPTFKLPMTRVTTKSMVTDRELPNTFVRHEYARRPAFNFDSSRFIAVSDNGWVRLMSVDKTSNKLTFMKTINVGEPQEPNWHPTDTKIIRSLTNYGEGMTIWEYNIETDVKTLKADLSSRVKAVFPNAKRISTIQEGRPSNDGNIWCFIAWTKNTSTGAEVPYGLVSYNLATNKILGTMAISKMPNHISTSPSGKYCIPSWAGDQTLGTRAYNVTFSSYKQIYKESVHSDPGYTKDGKEVFVFPDYFTGHLAMMDLDTGTRTNLFSIWGTRGAATDMHISTVGNQGKPGYVLVSFYKCRYQDGSPCTAGEQWFHDKVVLVELKATPTIYNLAHTRRGDAGYWSEPTAVSNRDFSHVVFSSTWGSTNLLDVSDYMLKLPITSLP